MSQAKKLLHSRSGMLQYVCCFDNMVLRKVNFYFMVVVAVVVVAVVVVVVVWFCYCIFCLQQL
jgi:hypothetical protein